MDWKEITQKAINARIPRTATRLAHDIGVSDVAVYYWLNGAEPKGERVLKLMEIAAEGEPKILKRQRGYIEPGLKKILHITLIMLIGLGTIGAALAARGFWQGFEKGIPTQPQPAQKTASTTQGMYIM